MILSAQTIRRLCTWQPRFEAQPPQWRGMVHPFEERQQHKRSGTSFGLSAAGYDVRLRQRVRLAPGDPMLLASTIERIALPTDVMGFVHDKSTWVRRGLTVQNTVLEPGWHGGLTLELLYHGTGVLTLQEGTPIAQIVFQRLDEPTVQPYVGKYQNQKMDPQEAL